MALPSSGKITLDNVRAELGRGSISLGHESVRTLANKPIGPIKLSDLYGKIFLGKVPRNGLVLEYLFNEAQGAAAIVNSADANGKFGNGVKINTPVMSPGKLGMGRYTGSLTAMRAGKLPAGDLTVSFDMYANDTASTSQAKYLIADFNSTGTNVSSRLALGLYGGYWSLIIGDGTTATFDTSRLHGLTLGKWYRITLTFTGNTVRLFVDSVLSQTWTGVVARSASVAPNNFAFGCGGDWLGNGGFFNGFMSRCRIWDRILTDDEIFDYSRESPAHDSGWNPADKGSNAELSMDNRVLRPVGAHSARGKISKSSGKHMYEMVFGVNNLALFGIGTAAATLAYYPGRDVNGWGYWAYNGAKFNNRSDSGAAYGSAAAIGDVIGVAVDLDFGTLTFYKNGVSMGVAYTGLQGKTVFPMGGSGTESPGTQMFMNTGEFGFAYPIAGFLPWT